MRKLIMLSLAGLAGFAGTASAAEYKIDLTHSFVEFRIQHLGYSWLYGRFNTMSGSMKYDAENPEASRIDVTVDLASVDTNHAERDKHLRSDDFLDVEKFSGARFESTSYTGTAEKGVLMGKLTLHGVTRPFRINVERVGEGADPWGGYRAGFIGRATLDRRHFGIEKNLGERSWTVELELGIEGIRK